MSESPQDLESGAEAPAATQGVRSSTPPEGFLRGWMWFGVANAVLAWIGVLGYYLAAAGHWRGGAVLLLLGSMGIVLAFFGVIVAAAWWRTGSKEEAQRALLAHALALVAVAALIALFALGYRLSL